MKIVFLNTIPEGFIKTLYFVQNYKANYKSFKLN